MIEKLEKDLVDAKTRDKATHEQINQLNGKGGYCIEHILSSLNAPLEQVRWLESERARLQAQVKSCHEFVTF